MDHYKYLSQWFHLLYQTKKKKNVQDEKNHLITIPITYPNITKTAFSTLRSHSKLICFRPKSEHFIVRRITYSAGEEKHLDKNDWNRTLESSIQVQLGLSL